MIKSLALIIKQIDSKVPAQSAASPVYQRFLNISSISVHNFVSYFVNAGCHLTSLSGGVVYG